MPQKLSRVLLDEVSLVDVPANQLAKVVLVKRDVDASKALHAKASLTEQQRKIEAALKEEFYKPPTGKETLPTMWEYYPTLRDFFPGQVVMELHRKLWRVPYEERADGTFAFDQPVQVEVTYTDISKATKTEAGVEGFPAEAYAYVPDAKLPSTWKLPLWDKPSGGPTASAVGRALAALGPGFRGKRAQVPAEDREGVKRKVLAAWKKVHPDSDDVPEVLKCFCSTEDQEEEVSKMDGLEDISKVEGVKFVIGFKEEGGSEIQSVIFDGEKWNEEKAKKWLKDHDLSHGKVDETSTGTLRFRQKEPSEFKRFRIVVPGEKKAALLDARMVVLASKLEKLASSFSR